MNHKGIQVAPESGARPHRSKPSGVGAAYTTPVNNEVRERTNSNFKDLTH